jgi:hypothetical protein
LCGIKDDDDNNNKEEIKEIIDINEIKKNNNKVLIKKLQK